MDVPPLRPHQCQGEDGSTIPGWVFRSQNLASPPVRMEAQKIRKIPASHSGFFQIRQSSWDAIANVPFFFPLFLQEMPNRDVPTCEIFSCFLPKQNSSSHEPVSPVSMKLQDQRERGFFKVQFSPSILPSRPHHCPVWAGLGQELTIQVARAGFAKPFPHTYFCCCLKAALKCRTQQSSTHLPGKN